MLLLAVQSAADAAAQAQTTTTVSGFTGGSTTSITGDTGKYVLGRAVAGGTEEVGRWYDRRFGDSFDVVYVKPGVQLTIHVEQEIPIDYNPAGRRVSYPGGYDVTRPRHLD